MDGHIHTDEHTNAYAQENKMKWMIEEKDETSSYDRGEKGKKVENGEWM